MSKADPEILSEISRLKASEKEAKVLDAAFDEGRFAFVSGIPRDECRFRNPARRNAWELGSESLNEGEAVLPRLPTACLPDRTATGITQIILEKDLK